jgi:phosphopantothenoylcysteine decarboxylase/phosphopantothenate--cysteine ligase
MHPSDDIRESKSNRLSGKKIVLGVTGSIAAVETIKLARELIRHGAEIIPVMTPSATKIIHPDILWFATGNKPIVELSGAAEHVSFCGRVKDPADLLLICPCTANTISKIAHGIDDTSVTTFATTAIGSNIPILIVPAMHLSMYDHKIIQENIRKCKTVKIKFIEPNIEKNKAKMPNIDEIAANVICLTGKQNLIKKRILIIGGPTAEYIDDLRIITNRSSGKTAVELAKNAFYQGANVQLWYGRGFEPVPEWIKKTDYTSLNDLLKLTKTKKLNQFDIIIICAALSDYITKKQKGKIPSGKDKLVLDMHPAPKIISILRKKAPKAKIVGFKVEEKKDKLKEKSMNLLKDNKLDFVVGNTISGFSSDENEIWIFNKKEKSINKKGKKEILADYILDSIK